jgi:hypothetical protein
VNFKELNLELAQDMGKLSRDPLKWVYYSFPWGEGELANYPGPEEWQRDILIRVRDEMSLNKALRVAVASGHGIGKSTLVAWLILWSLSTCPDAKGVVTANTGTQLKTKTWAELSKWYNRFIAKHWFDIAATSLTGKEKGHESTWRIDSISWSKNNTEAFAGLHNQGKRITVIFDEASAIDDAVWEVTEGALTDKDTEILWFAFGNPTRNTGSFRECFRKYRDRWNHIHIDSRTVNITNKTQIQQWVDDYGEDSDFVKVRVKGEFPDVSDTQLISSEMVRQAMTRYLTEQDIAGAPKIFGVDVAGTGSDKSAIWMRQGLYARRLYKKDIKDTSRFTDIIATFIREENPTTVFIDMGAMGSPVLDNLRRLGFGHVVQGIFFSNAAIRDDLYVNRRAEMWHSIAKWLKDGGVLPAKAPESQDIEDDLTSPEYFYSAKGKMQLESKEDMKERGLPSPDDGDALALTFAAPVRNRPHSAFAIIDD